MNDADIDDLVAEPLPCIGVERENCRAWLPLYIGALPIPLDFCVCCGATCADHPPGSFGEDDGADEDE